MFTLSHLETREYKTTQYVTYDPMLRYLLFIFSFMFWFIKRTHGLFTLDQMEIYVTNISSVLYDLVFII